MQKSNIYTIYTGKELPPRATSGNEGLSTGDEDIFGDISFFLGSELGKRMTEKVTDFIKVFLNKDKELKDILKKLKAADDNDVDVNGVLNESSFVILNDQFTTFSEVSKYYSNLGFLKAYDMIIDDFTEFVGKKMKVPTKDNIVKRLEELVNTINSDNAFYFGKDSKSLKYLNVDTKDRIIPTVLLLSNKCLTYREEDGKIVLNKAAASSSKNGIFKSSRNDVITGLNGIINGLANAKNDIEKTKSRMNDWKIKSEELKSPRKGIPFINRKDVYTKEEMGMIKNHFKVQIEVLSETMDGILDNVQKFYGQVGGVANRLLK